MSFSSETKSETVELKTSRDERARMLFALTHAAGTILLGRSGLGIRYVTEHSGTAKLIARIAHELYGLTAEISVSESTRLSAKNFVVDVSGDRCRELLNDSGCLTSGTDGELNEPFVPMDTLEDDVNARAFIRGAFLGCGSLSDPKKSYHLEFVCKSEGFASGLLELINRFYLGAKLLVRKELYVVYIKDSECISDFLALIGAMSTTLDYENARVVRDVTNNANRRQNFELANIDKAAMAAAKELIDIEIIEKHMGLDKLPVKLRQTAEARLNNPEASLSELAELLDIGRSGVNHRLNKLAEIADSLKL